MCADEHNRFLSSNSESSTWIVDSGASRHICAYRTLFTDLQPIHNSTVTLPNHSTILVLFFGDITLKATLILKNVLYVLGFKFNLISIGTLTLNSHFVVSFSDVDFFIKDISSRKTIGKGRRCNDLYVFQAAQHPISFPLNKASAQPLHDCLGHPS